MSFSLCSLSHILMLHQYLMYHVPTDCAIPTIPRWNCRVRFQPAAHFCISLLKAHSQSAMEIIANSSTWVMYNSWEEESGTERAWRGSVCPCVCVCACACVCLSPDQRWYKGHAPPKSEDGSSSEVSRPKFTKSRSYKFIGQQSEMCAGLSGIMLAYI